ncbi:MAG: LruC domain-containing protein [Bacteroidales bacterium]
MKKQIVAVMAIAACFMTQACVKNATTPEENNNPPKVQELNVPPTFNWVTSKTITCTVNSTVAVPVGIYLDKECAEELLATFTVSESNVVPLSVPSATASLYIKYKSASGNDKIAEQILNNDAVAFTISDAATKGAAGTKADDVPVYDGKGYISYPADWGTVLFEDLFPALGDYDFNDCVMSYQVAVEFPWKNGKYDTQHTKQIRIHLRLRAIGGVLAFTPYVRVAGLDKSIVSMPNPPYNNPAYVNPGIYNDTKDGVQVSLVDSKLTQDVVVEFKNLNARNPFRLPGTAFYNTEHGETIKHDQLTEVFVYLSFSRELEVRSLLDEKIDIFLASADKTKEIHVKGFYPVFSEYDFNRAGVDKKIPYASDKNLVWGIKIPKGSKFLHVAEKINFCDAYKDFAPWVTSGGTTNKDWYNTNKVEENLIKWKK